MTSKRPRLYGNLTFADLRNERLWVSGIGMYLLWFEFLALSPSYEMARRVRSGKTVNRSDLPEDFDRVLSVYDDLGDVQHTLFWRWWHQVGLQHFGHQGRQPNVTRVTSLQADQPTTFSSLQRYIDENWNDQGQQNTMLLAIPVGLPEGKIIRQLKQHLDKLDPTEKVLKEPQAKYPLVGQRHHRDALIRYLSMALFRCASHDRPLWYTGARAKVSETYSPLLDPKQIEPEDADRFDRQMLTIIASRALLRARMIAENAARGRFPTHEKCPEALEFDFQSMLKLVVKRTRWQKKEMDRLEAEGLPEPASH